MMQTQINVLKQTSDKDIEEKFAFLVQLYAGSNTGLAIIRYPDYILLKANDCFMQFAEVSYDQLNIYDSIMQSGNSLHLEEQSFTHPSRGSTYWDLSYIPINNLGQPKFLVQTTLDVTEKVMKRKRSDVYLNNRLIQVQYDLLNIIIKNLDLGFIRCSYPDFKIIDLNNRSLNYLKQVNFDRNSREKIIGCNIFHAFQVEDWVKFQTDIQHLIKNSISNHSIYLKTILYGESKYYKIFFQLIYESEQKIKEVMFLCKDITDEAKAKKQAEKIHEVHMQLFPKISHELNTPLSLIYNTVQLFEHYFKNGIVDDNITKIEKNIQVLKQNCYRLTRLINNVNDIYKLESGYFRLHLSNVDIVSIVENTTLSTVGYLQTKSMNIIFNTDTEEKIIACDPDEIQRVVLNLISNAIKFSQGCKEIAVNVYDKGDILEIAVQDNGIGIDQEQLDSIFKRFYQVNTSLSRDVEGSGLGLSLVKDIVELHGGKVSAESKIEQGSIFRVKLPVRTIENSELNNNTQYNNYYKKIEIEFSDIY